MSRSRPTDTAARRINVGIYGDTRAGKTRFLFELLSGWNRNHRILWMSEMASRFLESVAIDVEQQGEPSPTSSQTEGIEVDVRLSSEVRVRIVLRDLRGGELARQIDTILVRNAGPPGDGLQAQVARYDAFLFFFDPTSSKTADNPGGHYDRERKRALLFAEYVHRRRQNSYLPIVFVATRRDLRDGDQAAQQRARNWLNDTCARIRQDYETRLGGHYPSSLVQPDVMALDVASTPDGNPEEAVQRLVELVDDVRHFRRHDFRRVAGSVLLGLAVVVLVAAVTCGIYWSTGGRWPNGGGSGPVEVGGVGGGQSPADPAAQLAEIETFLNRLSPDGRLADPRQAKLFNQHLSWLLAAAETGEVAEGGTPAEPNLARRLEDARAAAVAVAARTAQAATATRESLDLLAACLADLPRLRAPPPQLMECYDRFWELYRQYAVDELATVIRNQDNAGSPPLQILNQLTARLDRLVNDVKLTPVHPPSAELGRPQNRGAAFADELAVTSQYGKNLLDNLGCTVRFQVTRAAYQSKYGITPTTRRVVFNSQRQTSPLTVRLRPQAAAETAGAARTEFDISPAEPADVKLAIGSLGTLTLGILLKETQVWEDFHTVDVRDLPSEGTSLAVLGLPVILRDEPRVRHALPVPEGYEMEVEFSGWHPPPDLLWEAVVAAE